jgi:hypothetical protein
MLPFAALRACSLLAFLRSQRKLHSEAASHLSNYTPSHGLAVWDQSDVLLNCTLTFDMLACSNRDGSRPCVLNFVNSNAMSTTPWACS